MANEAIRESMNTRVAGQYDVIVAGGGASGLVAAVSAARAGAPRVFQAMIDNDYQVLGQSHPCRRNHAGVKSAARRAASPGECLAMLPRLRGLLGP